MTGRPPLVLIETGVEGIPNPVVTADDSVTVVILTWDTDLETDLMRKAIRVLTEVEGDHPRIDATLERLRARVLDRDRAELEAHR